MAAINTKRAGVRYSTNHITVPQLKLACKHYLEMREAGCTMNFAIRLLELFTDIYSRQVAGFPGLGAPLSVKFVEKKWWSRAAKTAQRKFPRKKPFEYLRVEHGTPRRALAIQVIKLHQKGALTEKSLKRLVNRYWKLAVITLEEDRRLNQVARSKMFPSPEKRWAAARIKF